MPEELMDAENNVHGDVNAESQAAGEDGQDGIDLSDSAESGANNTAKDDLTKGMSKRINEIRAKEVEPLRAQIADLEKECVRMQELEIELKAIKEGKSVEDVIAEQAEQEKTRRELIENDPRIKEAKRIKFDAQYKEVLDAIQSKHPDDNVTKLEDLGEDFFRMLASGIDPVKAYRVTRDEKIEQQPSKKELPGSVKGNGSSLGKSFTEDQVRNMTTEEVIANYDAVMEAKKKW